MNRLSVFVRLLAMLLVAAFVLPASAAPPQKIYTLTVSPLAVPSGGNDVTMTALFTNVSPTGANSSFNSLILKAPEGIRDLKFVSAKLNGAPFVVSPGNLEQRATEIRISNSSPIGRNQNFEITFTADIDPGSCSAMRWQPNDPVAVPPATSPVVYLWTGSSFSGDEFKLTNDPVTNRVSDLALSFSGLPTSATQNVVMPTFTVTATSSCGTAAFFSGPVVITSNCTGTNCLTGTTTKNATSGVATFSDLKFTTLGSFTLTATGLGVSKTSAPITVHAGTLSCEGASSSFPSTFPDADGDGTTNGVRGNNKDGSPCEVVNYTFTDDIAVNNRTIFSWDIAAQPAAVFKYSVKFLPEFVGSDGLPVHGLTKVQWFDSSGSPFPPDTSGPGTGAVQAKSCLSKDLPSAYSTLSVNLPATGAGSDTVKLSAAPSSTPAVPFPIVIESERMTVIQVVSATEWKVARGTSEGEVDAPVQHLIGKQVMSTPFPLFTFGGAPRVMQMCIAKEVWQPVPAGAADCDVNPAAPNACTQNTTTVIDGGDGIMIRG
jgi:hypothetical protein